MYVSLPQLLGSAGHLYQWVAVQLAVVVSCSSSPSTTCTTCSGFFVFSHDTQQHTHTHTKLELNEKGVTSKVLCSGYK